MYNTLESIHENEKKKEKEKGALMKITYGVVRLCWDITKGILREIILS